MPRRLAALARQTRLWPVWARYVATAAIVLVAMGLRWILLGPGTGYPYITAFPAVILSGLVFNRGSAVLAVALSALVGVLLFVEPTGSLYIPNPTDAVAMVIFLATSLFIAVLIEDLHLVVLDLTEANRRLAVADAEQDVLRREAFHRRQNDLHRLISTLRLQAQAFQDERVRAALTDAVGRVQALSRVDVRFERHHDGQGTVNTHDLLVGLGSDLRETGGADLRPIAFEVSAEAHDLPREQAVTLGLMATELITNALKYAFPEERAGTVSVGFRREGDASC